MDKYYQNIKGLIESHLIEEKKNEIKTNYHKVKTYYEIGKTLIKAQGGKERATYGNQLVKKYALLLAEEYGVSYNYKSLLRIRQFYLCFEKVAPVGRQFELSWTHYKILLPIKNENKRNYYINSAIEHGFSKRQLIAYIKSNAYERLLKNDNIKLKYIDNNKSEETDILSMIKNPILIKINKKINKITEKALKSFMIEQIEATLLELGMGFGFMGSEIPIKINGKIHRPDLVFFNTEFNSYIIFELKIRDLRKEDIGQIEFYVNYYDAQIKKSFHNPTVGITVSKRVDADIVKYIPKDNIKHTTYELN